MSSADGRIAFTCSGGGIAGGGLFGEVFF